MHFYVKLHVCRGNMYILFVRKIENYIFQDDDAHAEILVVVVVRDGITFRSYS